MTHWLHHPGVRSGDDLTLGERAADRMRGSMGSWTFVFVFLVFMAIWAAGNGKHGFDPYPYILLNLFLSMLAGLQGAILLIAAKRADQVASEVAKHTLENTQQHRELLEANQNMLQVNTTQTEQIHVLTEQIHALLHADDRADL